MLVCVCVGGGALSGRHRRWLPWKQRDSVTEGWKDREGVDWV